MQNLTDLQTRLSALTLFRALLQDSVIAAFSALPHPDTTDDREAVSRTALFFAALLQCGGDFGSHIQSLVFADENAYVLRAGENQLTPVYTEALAADLSVLQALCRVTAADICAHTRVTLPFPPFPVHDRDLSAAYQARMQNIHKVGYGIYAKYSMFCLKDGKIAPVKHPDTQRLSDFSGYEAERARVIANTKALLNGDPCNNVLLYGDAGSGKSSTVKALANAFYGDGLRLIEVRKNELFCLPDVLDTLAKNPLKFIIFIDDLSFTADDADFGALKAILEGSVAGRSRNIAIYATSNRRHLVKESVCARDGDDLHVQDTIQELTSLSARFGIQVTFSRPNQALYLKIVRDLAQQHRLQLPEEELAVKAEAFALRNGGRSPRTAKQFVEYTAYSENRTPNTGPERGA